MEQFHPSVESKALLIISQAYPPDPASVGQHLADVATEMAGRGHLVHVLTSSRGYTDPSTRYPSYEVARGVDVRRLPLSSLGRSSIPIRVVAQLSFLAQCILRGLLLRRLDGVFITTSPPMSALAALVIGSVRRVPIQYWVMDLNPDQVIELGKTREGTVPVRLMDWLNRMILRRAEDVVALDRFMVDRLTRKARVDGKVTIIPPWPHNDHLAPISAEGNPFRHEHKLEGKFVIMYSGNHSFANPIRTVLEAALRMHQRNDVVFVFVGGGAGKSEVEQLIRNHQPPHILSLPYEPLDQIKYSLAAADVHIVTMGNHLAGCVHPCKVYGAMAAGRPILYLGPDPSHVMDLIRAHSIGWHVEHGDVEGAVETFQRCLSLDRQRLREMGTRGQIAITERYSQKTLCTRMGDLIERRIA